MPKVSVIIPAHNEGGFIAEVLGRVLAADLSGMGLEKEVLVVDDGSSDSTFETASSFPGVSAIRKGHGGKGSAVREGIARSTGEYILIQDADLEYSPSDYPVMLKTMLEAPLGTRAVYGSRFLGARADGENRSLLPGKHPAQSLGPYAANLVLTAVSFALFGKTITDNLTAYKLYPAEILRAHEFKTSGFETDHEITCLLLKNKVEILEVPIGYSPRSVDEGKKIRAKDGFRAVMTFVRHRF
jgi:glycosyltransferase involved in cell wall biosynthesis